MARQTLDRNVKFKMLVNDLSLSKPLARGLLELMWDCANESGNPLFRSAREVEAAAEWTGEAGALAETLANVGFLDRLEAGEFEIHDYWDHAPEYVRKRREREQERQQKGAGLRKRQTTADNGRQRQTFPENGGQRQISAENGRPRTPSPSHTPSPSTSGSHAREVPAPGPAAAACCDWFDLVEQFWCQVKPDRTPNLSAAEREALRCYAEEGVPVEVVTQCVGEIVTRQDAAGRPVGRFSYFTGGILAEAVLAWREGRSTAPPFELESYRAMRTAMLRDPGAALVQGLPAELVERVARAVERASSTREVDAALQALVRQETAA